MTDILERADAFAHDLRKLVTFHNVPEWYAEAMTNAADLIDDLCLNAAASTKALKEIHEIAKAPNLAPYVNPGKAVMDIAARALGHEVK